MANGEDIELADDAPKGGFLKIAIIGLTALLVLGGGGAGAAYFMGALPGSGGDTVADADGEGGADGGATDAQRKAAIYVPLERPFTVNFQKAGRARFLQVTVEAMTRDPAVKDALEQHMPMIRNNLLMLFSSKSSDELRSRDGKEALQNEALASVQGILEQETGSKGVEAIFFTSFVMQ